MRTKEVMNLKAEITKLIKQVVEEMVEDAREYRWIPVGERLPERDVDCIVSYNADIAGGKVFPVSDDAYSGIVWWDGEKWVNEDSIPIGVIVTAWWPLPKPYHPEVYRCSNT